MISIGGDATVRIPVPRHPVAEWFTFIPKKIYVPIPVSYAAHQSGMKHIRSVLSWKKESTTSKTAIVLPDAEHRMKKLCMRIYYYQGLLN